MSAPARRAAGVLLALAGLLAGHGAAAHKASDAYLSLAPHGSQVEVRWDIALRDLDGELGLDADDDGDLTWGEVRARQRDIEALALPQLHLAADRAPCRVVTGADGHGVVGLALDRHSDGGYAVLQFTFACPATVARLDIDYHLFATSDPTHRGILRVLAPDAPGRVAATAVLGPDHPERHVDLLAPSVLETLRDFVGEGIWHIWLGYDHILFLLSLLLPAVLGAAVWRPAGATPAAGGLDAPGLRATATDVLKTVTAFTLAHSITLTLAVLDLVTLPSRLVESGIALTVVLASLNNLRPVLRERRWAAAFLFGLIHGFGFAAALKDLGLGAGSLAVSLFGFNLGVELGQLAIVVVFVPLAYLARDTRLYRVGVFRGGSAAVAVLAALWFVERAFDVDLGRLGLG